MPKTITFATKPKLGRALLERAFATGVPCAWVVGDSVYGADHALRRCIEQHGRGYVLTVTSAQGLDLKPVEDWLEDVPARAWRPSRPAMGARDHGSTTGSIGPAARRLRRAGRRAC